MASVGSPREATDDQVRMPSNIVCFLCGRFGNKAYRCRNRQQDRNFAEPQHPGEYEDEDDDGDDSKGKPREYFIKG